MTHSLLVRYSQFVLKLTAFLAKAGAAVGVAVAAVMVCTTPARAAPLEASYVVVDQPLRGAIEAFGGLVGARVEVAGSVTGQAKPGLLRGGVGELVRYATGHGAFAYYDGSTYWFSADRTVVRVIALDGIETGVAAAAVDRLFPVRPLGSVAAYGDANALRVAGPVAFVDAIEAALRALRASTEVEIIKFGNKHVTKKP